MDAGHEDRRFEGMNLSKFPLPWHFTRLKTFYLFTFSERFIMILVYGGTELPITLQEARLGLTYKRPSYRPTGTHPSPRFVLVWGSADRSTSLLSTRPPVLCTHWSLMGNTAPPHWVVTRGRRWLVHRPPYSATVTGKGSMLFVPQIARPKQESVSSVTMKKTVSLVTRESGLAQQDHMEISRMTPTRVEMRLSITPHPIMEVNTSKPWVTSWCSKSCNLHSN